MVKPITLERSKGRKSKGAWSFVQLPHALLSSTAVTGLSGRAAKALLFLCAQFKGSNNGDLQCAWKLAQAASWNSRAGLQLALAELTERGLIIRTRQGGRNRCSLYALAWFPIDANPKLDHPWQIGTRTAANQWRQDGENCSPPVGQRSPPVGQSAKSTQGKSDDYPTGGSVRALSATGLPH